MSHAREIFVLLVATFVLFIEAEEILLVVNDFAQLDFRCRVLVLDVSQIELEALLSKLLVAGLLVVRARRN